MKNINNRLTRQSEDINAYIQELLSLAKELGIDIWTSGSEYAQETEYPYWEKLAQQFYETPGESFQEVILHCNVQFSERIAGWRQLGMILGRVDDLVCLIILRMHYKEEQSKLADTLNQRRLEYEAQMHKWSARFDERGLALTKPREAFAVYEQVASRATDCYASYTNRLISNLDDFMKYHGKAYPYLAVQRVLSPDDYGIFQEAASLRPAVMPEDYSALSNLWAYVQQATLPEQLAQIIAGLDRHYADYQQAAATTNAAFKQFYPND